jgi:hypothetical protein
MIANSWPLAVISIDSAKPTDVTLRRAPYSDVSFFTAFSLFNDEILAALLSRDCLVELTGENFSVFCSTHALLLLAYYEGE